VGSSGFIKTEYMEMGPIYLDYNATTPLLPEVMDAMRPYLEERFGNPSSAHAYGRLAKAAVETARRQVASLLNARPDEIIFTGGGTESNNLAIKGAVFANRDKGNHIITSMVEHPAVSEVCRYLERHGFTVTWLAVDGAGMVDPDDIRRAITDKTILITVMHANNETGTIEPVEEIGRIAGEHGILFHTDAAQSVGKIPVDVAALNVSLLSVAGHKLYAPKGVGALYVRRGVRLEKLIHGADHESNLRPGTENVAQIVGLGMASALCPSPNPSPDKVGKGPGVGPFAMRSLRDRLHEGILASIPGVRLNGHPEKRLPNTLSIGFPGVDANRLLDKMKGVAASAGAACHAGDEKVSGVLAAMLVPMEYATGTVRFSLGRMTTAEEIDKSVEQIVTAYKKIAGYGMGDAGFEIQNADPTPGPSPKREGNLHPASVSIRLTEYTHSLGCACKIRPQMLEKILRGLPPASGDNILVGHETSDDAAVYRISDDTAIVETVDFIPPVVDDPYMYGAISAANALSDIYAMGAKPLFALSIVGFPDRLLPPEVLQQILRGATDKASEAGIQVIGGHSIEDSEPKFGLVVTGIVHPDRVLRNSTARPGDALILTKPLGTGIITTAIKQGLAEVSAAEAAMRSMAELNRPAAEIMEDFPVNACTDVSGFGLLGHLKEMVCGSGVGAALDRDSIPAPDAAWQYAAAGAVPGGTKNNLDFVEDVVQWRPETPELLKLILADAQTSGGLLISLPEAEASSLVDRLRGAGVTPASVIGRIVEGPPRIIV